MSPLGPSGSAAAITGPDSIEKAQPPLEAVPYQNRIWAYVLAVAIFLVAAFVVGKGFGNNTVNVIQQVGTEQSPAGNTHVQLPSIKIP